MKQKLLLVGTGPTHVAWLAWLARYLPKDPMHDFDITLVSSARHLFLPPMLPGFVAGRWRDEDCSVGLDALIEKTGVTWLHGEPQALDAPGRAMLLDDGQELTYDWLSIDSPLAGPPDRIEQAMPGARKNGLFAQPNDAFCNLWPQVQTFASRQAVRITVVCEPGAGLDGLSLGFELALALRQRLPGSAVSLVTGGDDVTTGRSEATARLMTHTLRQRNVTVFADTVVGIAPGQLSLGSGASLACDVPLIANALPPPPWLGESGLVLDDRGDVEVDHGHQSLTHQQVFSWRGSDPVAMARQLIGALRGGPVQAKTQIRTDDRKLGLLSCGSGQAIASWGSYAAQGRWASWLRNWRDRAAVAKLRRNG